MKVLVRKLMVITVLLTAVAGLTGCATSAKSIDSGEELAKASDQATGKVVFGKFRLIRNGQEAKLGDSILTTSATLYLFDTDDNREIVGSVGKDGEFAWVLDPGHYSVAAIGFDNRGENVESPTDYIFTVSADDTATYVGTITLEATMESGYLGINGTIDRYTVSNDCDRDCASRLAQLGLAADSAVVRLMREERQVARTF